MTIRQRIPLTAWEAIVAKAAPAHPHPATMIKKKIQKNIQHSGECKKQKWCPAVSDGPQDAGKVVVKQRKGQAQENDHQVGVSVVVNVAFNRKYLKNPRTKQGAECGDDTCNGCSHNGTIENNFFHVRKITRTEIFCYGNSEAGTASHTKAEDHELDTGAGPDAGQCLCTKILADNGGINDIVGLLQEVADQKRKGKLQHHP